MRVPANQEAVTDHESRHCRFPETCPIPGRLFDTIGRRKQHEEIHEQKRLSLLFMDAGLKILFENETARDRLIPAIKTFGGDIFAPAVLGLLTKELRRLGIPVRQSRGRSILPCVRCGAPIVRGACILQVSAGWRHVLCPVPQNLGDRTS